MRFIKHISIALLVGVFGGCNLEQMPHDQISLNQAFSTINDARAWKIGMYGTLRSNLYGRNMMLSDIQSDMLNATVLATSGQYLDFHRWETLTASDADLHEIWTKIYSAITDINVGLAGLKTMSFPNRAEHQKELNAIIGELHLARAYYNLYLATHFCKAYKESSAATDLGIPLQLETKISREIKRSSLRQTYEQILADIVVAETNLTGVEYDGTSGLKPFNTFFIEAVQMLKARTFLYMEKWKEAYDVAQILMADPDYPLIDPMMEPTALKSMWHNDGGSETITQLDASPTETPQANNLYLGHYAPRNTPWIVSTTPWYVPAQWVIDLYEMFDFRRQVYFKQDRAFINNTSYTNVWVVNKYPGNTTIANAQFRFHQPKMFRIAEAYLIAAEAGYHIGADALTPLNKLKEARWLDPVTLSGTALLQEIKDERTREFAFEGMRMMDLKRWGESVKRHTPQDVPFLQKTPIEQFEQLDRSASDPKMIWGIPGAELKFGAQQNAGW